MLVELLVLLIVVGVVLYAITLVPMDAAIQKLIRIVVILAAVLYVLKALGLFDRLNAL